MSDLVWRQHPDLGLVAALPVPNYPAASIHGFLELPDGSFVRLDLATDDDFTKAADLSRKRLRRCRFGSQTWWWHTCVIAAHQRRRRARLTLVPGGAP